MNETQKALEKQKISIDENTIALQD